MKKFVSLILTVLLSISLLTACKVEDNGGDNGNETSSVVFMVDGVEKSQVTIIKGQNDLNITASYKGTVDKSTTWTVADESIVSYKIKKPALPNVATFTGLKAGTTTVTATNAIGESGSIQITVAEGEISCAVDKVSIYLCDTVKTYNLASQITVNGGSVSYKSEDSTIASVTQEGLITGLRQGTTTITATEKYSKTAKNVTVNVYNDYVNPATSTVLISLDESVEIPFITEIANVQYTVDNTSIAGIVDGKLKGLSLGETKVKATYNGKTYEVNVKVVSTKISNYTVTNNLNDATINYYGRNYYYSAKSAMAFSYGASGFEVSFYGTELKANMLKIYSQSANHNPQMQILVDGAKVPTNDANAKKVVLSSTTASEVTLVSGLKLGFHTVKVLKRSGFISGTNKESVAGLTKISTDGYLIDAPTKPSLKIDIYGDSITHGYGNLTSGSSPEATQTNSLLTYGYLVAESLNAQVYKQGHSGWGIYFRSSGQPDVNTQWYNTYDKYYQYNGSGFTTATWNYDNYQPDIIIINLGTNDASATSHAQFSNFKLKYKEMIEGLKQKCPNAKFLLVYGMMGTNATISNEITQVANSYNYVEYLNIADARTSGGHPLIAQHVTYANAITNKLRTML